jgi:hypothetical protein
VKLVNKLNKQLNSLTQQYVSLPEGPSPGSESQRPERNAKEQRIRLENM